MMDNGNAVIVDVDIMLNERFYANFKKKYRTKLDLFLGRRVIVGDFVTDIYKKYTTLSTRKDVRFCINDMIKTN